MSIEERIKYAERRRDEAIRNGAEDYALYQSAYLDGVKAVQRDLKNG